MNNFQNGLAMSDAVQEVERVCEKHGAYLSKTLMVLEGMPPLQSGCPACKAEKEAEDARMAQERIEANRVAEEAHEAKALDRRIRNAHIPARFMDRTLDTYRAEGSGQVRALATARKFVNRVPDGASLVFVGEPGTGKTHLACGIAHEAIRRGFEARFSTVLSAIRKVKSTYRKDSEWTESEVIQFFATVDLLVLDEVGAQLGSEHEKMLMFEIINERYQNLKSTVLISNLNAADLTLYLGDRFMDRFREGGAVVAFDWGSYRGQA